MLPLDVEVEEESPYPTLEEAAKMATNGAAGAHFSRLANKPDSANDSWNTDDSTSTIPIECGSSYNSEATSSTSHKAIQQYIGHAIPKEFLLKSGLLDSASGGKNDSIGPIYKLKSDGSTIGLIFYLLGSVKQVKLWF